MSNIIIRFGFSALTNPERESWCSLFSNAFSKGDEEACRVLRKYEQKNATAVFCLGYKSDELVASYSGLIFKVGGINIFVSMDTMSAGVIPNATVELARKLYPLLSKNGVDAVCGFPNRNIISIRRRKLGWEMVGRMYAYIGIPFLWRFGIAKNNQEKSGWHIERPKHGFFGKKIRFVRLLGRNGLYAGNLMSFIMALGVSKPGLFFIKVPSSIIQPKQFGYFVFDAGNTKVLSAISDMANCLDLDSIDVP